MDYDVNETFSATFMKRNTHLWDKSFLEGAIKFLKKYKSSDGQLENERCFVEFILEIEQAYSAFLNKINDLPMMMKCRVKGDNKAHFGGQECAELVRALRSSAEKYLKSTSFKNDKKFTDTALTTTLNNENVFVSIYDFVSRIRDMARTDEKIAKEIEARVYQEYVSLGKDHTLDALKAAGYNFDNISL